MDFEEEEDEEVGLVVLVGVIMGVVGVEGGL